MNQRELSEKLDALATELEAWGNNDDISDGVVFKVAEELRKLSNENYAPGNGMAWSDIKPKPVNKTFVDKSGKKLPF